jgi:nicotinate-nucleotide--dimethylbenzimidazole phosphoribosyltransferase
MGIGNTTPSAVLIGHFLHKSAEAVAGRGAGLSDEGLKRKTKVIGRALARISGIQDSMAALAAGGGLEIAMMAGVYLGGAEYHVPVILDGVISQAAALAAVMIRPEVRKILIPSHISGESCGTFVLSALGLSPAIDGNLSLGEGSGAMFLLPLLDGALAVYRQMASFTECSIKPYERFEEKS